jgi:tetratricopeptide (TPR) repeat protein
MSSFNQFPLSPNVEILDEDGEDNFVDCSEDPLPTQSDPLLQDDANDKGEEEDEYVYHQEAKEKRIEDEFLGEKDITQALSAKEKGNDYFRCKDYDNAIQCYSTAIEYCPIDKEYEEQLAAFYGNRAAAYAAEDDHDLVVDDCTAALELKPDYTKVLIRRMQAYEKLQKYEEALTGI